MFAEVLAIGDELTSGQRVDTNSAWLSQRLAEIGIPVRFHTTAGDDLRACTAAIRSAVDRADIVISTGGLGPTADDLTRDAIAAAAGVELRFDPQVLIHIRALFERRGRPMPPQNRVQAMFPSGCEILPNPHGTAPGIDLRINRSSGGSARLFALPGVPAEMREMWGGTILSALEKLAGHGQRIVHHRVKCFGVGESDLEQRLPDLIRRGRMPSVGITVHEATITLRVTASGADERACRALMQPTLATIRDTLGTLVFGEQDDELEHVVTRLLAVRRATLSTAEWATSGLLAQWLHAASEGDGSFLGGVTVGSPTALHRGLALECDLRSASSPEICRDMAEAARGRWGSDLGLAVGAFPTRHDDQGTGRVHVALATGDSCRVTAHRAMGHPSILLPRTAKIALNRLRLHLLAGEETADPNTSR